MTPIRCSDATGCAGPCGDAAAGARSLIGVGLAAIFSAGPAFFGGARRTGGFLATLLRIVLAFLTVLLRVALLTGVFLRLALPLAFFLFTIESLLPLTALAGLRPHRCRSRS